VDVMSGYTSTERREKNSEPLDRCGSAEIRALLLEAAEEFGRSIG
jgi:hypothetical protein